MVFDEPELQTQASIRKFARLLIAWINQDSSFAQKS